MVPRHWASKPTQISRGGRTCCERSATSCSGSGCDLWEEFGTWARFRTTRDKHLAIQKLRCDFIGGVGAAACIWGRLARAAAVPADQRLRAWRWKPSGGRPQIEAELRVDPADEHGQPLYGAFVV